MSDSGEYKTSEQESKSQEGETTKNSKKRMIDADDDEDPKNQSSKLENLKKVAKKTLPLACSICKEPFLDPIVTKCNHYFCHLCALERHGKNNKCFLCDQQTLGVFNTAVEIKKKISQVREKAKVMVKEVKTMVENAAVIVKEAEAMAAESAEMVAGVETLVGILETFGPNSVADPSWHSVINLVENVEDIAENARAKAEKAAEMVKEANAATETARAEMAKALVVMKNVKWNV